MHMYLLRLVLMSRPEFSLLLQEILFVGNHAGCSSIVGLEIPDQFEC
jgi:hypothetical protein